EVNYGETLRRAMKTQGECIKQAGTASLFARLSVEFTPKKIEPKADQAIAVLTKIPALSSGEPALPEELVSAAEQGIRGALQSGELGYPVINVQATIIGGHMPEGLSHEVAFQVAGAAAGHQTPPGTNLLPEPVMPPRNN